MNVVWITNVLIRVVLDVLKARIYYPPKVCRRRCVGEFCILGPVYMEAGLAR